MYKNKIILCIIPARGGSKGLPGKNIKELMGKPLIVYTIEHALASKYVDRVIISTDDVRIADIAKKYSVEVPFLRPGELATDYASTIDVLIHAIDWLRNNEDYNFDILVLLHVTTPLRKTEDLDNCIELLVENNADNVFSVTEAHRNPYFNMVEVQKNTVKLVKKGNFVTRQSAPKVFDMNSSIYVWWRDIFKEKKSIFLGKSNIYIMPKERSIDIDDHIDFKLAEMLLKESALNVEEYQNHSTA